MKRFSSVMAMVGCLAATSAGASAQDIWSNEQDSLVAGVYVNFQFGGPPPKEDPLSFGFAAGMRRELRSELSFNDLTGRRPIEITVIDTRFDSHGFNRLSVAGLPFVERGFDGGYYVLGADETDNEGKPKKKGMGTFGKVLLWTGGILAVGTAAFAIYWHEEWKDVD